MISPNTRPPSAGTINTRIVSCPTPVESKVSGGREKSTVWSHWTSRRSRLTTSPITPPTITPATIRSGSWERMFWRTTDPTLSPRSLMRFRGAGWSGSVVLSIKRLANGKKGPEAWRKGRVST